MSQGKSSLLKMIIAIVVLIALTSMVLHTAFSWMPRNLQDVEGVELSEGIEVVNLNERLKESVSRSYEIAITEGELNQYIASKLELTQSPIIDDYIKIKGVYVDVKPNLLDISIEREFDYPQNLKEDGSKKVGFLPFTQTVSMQLEIETVDDADGSKTKRVKFPGANFGQSPAPGLFVYLVKPSFETIAEFFSDEIDIAYNQMTAIKVEEGVVKLDPSPLVQTQKPTQ